MQLLKKEQRLKVCPASRHGLGGGQHRTFEPQSSTSTIYCRRAEEDRQYCSAHNESSFLSHKPLGCSFSSGAWPLLCPIVRPLSAGFIHYSRVYPHHYSGSFTYYSGSFTYYSGFFTYYSGFSTYYSGFSTRYPLRILHLLLRVLHLLLRVLHPLATQGSPPTTQGSSTSPTQGSSTTRFIHHSLRVHPLLGSHGVPGRMRPLLIS